MAKKITSEAVKTQPLAAVAESALRQLSEELQALDGIKGLVVPNPKENDGKATLREISFHRAINTLQNTIDNLKNFISEENK